MDLIIYILYNVELYIEFSEFFEFSACTSDFELHVLPETTFDT